MRQNKTKRLIALFPLIMFITSFFGIFMGMKVEASDNKEGFNSFSIHAVPSEWQIDPKISYFYLKADPGSQQTIKVEIKNNSDQEQTYSVLLNNAGTNSNGLITYTKENKKVKNKAGYSIQDLAKIENPTITIPKGESKEASILLNIPKVTFEGIVVGGIKVEVNGKKEEKTNSQGMSVGSTYEYVIGLVVTEDETYPSQGLGDIKLSRLDPELDNGKKVVSAYLKNENAQVFGEFTMEGAVTKKGSTEIVAEKKIENARIAPNTEMPFQLDWGMKTVEAGQYIFKGKASGKEDPSKVWDFEEEFTITANQAEKLNKDSAFRIIMPQLFIIGFVLLAVLSTLLLLLLSIRMRKSQALLAKRKKRKKRKKK